jgi:hypothetical protein
MAEGETEDFVKNEVVFGVFAFFCMSLHTSFYGAMTASISSLNYRHLSMKRSTPKNDRIIHPPFGGLSSEHW